MERRVARLPLHGGKAPPWLFQRMTRLAGAMTMAIVDAHGPTEMLRRLSDPWWFQAFGCVLGFDWHSSGVTTVTCGAMAQAYRRLGDDLGLCVAGGKAMTGRKAPEQIARDADRLGITAGQRLIEASRLSAKVDSAAVQDGYRIYHHSFFFIPDGGWAVVQQGMARGRPDARRYHWFGEEGLDFVCEPHAGIEDLGGAEGPAGRDGPPRRAGDDLPLLNMVAGEADASRRACVALLREPPDRLIREARRATEGPTLFAPDHHPVLPRDVNLDRLERIMTAAHERCPADYATLLGTEQVGPATVRSLALIAELVYGASPSRRDPADRAAGSPAACGDNRSARQSASRRWADYSYAHGGKDGTPFPVDRVTYDRSIGVLEDAVRRARVGDRERTEALRRIARLAGEVGGRP